MEEKEREREIEGKAMECFGGKEDCAVEWRMSVCHLELERHVS